MDSFVSSENIDTFAHGEHTHRVASTAEAYKSLTDRDELQNNLEQNLALSVVNRLSPTKTTLKDEKIPLSTLQTRHLMT